MTFFLKIAAGLVVVVVGSVLLVNNVPSLKANILEAINPRIHEQELIDQLKSNLQAIDASITAQLQAPNITVEKAKSTQLNNLIDESKGLLNEIDTMNSGHTGIVDGVINKATELLISSSASPTPQIVPSSNANGTTSGSSIGSQPAVVTVTVTVTPSPCK